MLIIILYYKLSLDVSILLFAKRLIPIIKNSIPDSSLSKNAGIRLAIEPPAKAPNNVANIRANEDPINTARGLLVVLLKVMVVNWVLSPISARNTVTKVVKKRVRIMILVQVLIVNKGNKTLEN